MNPIAIILSSLCLLFFAGCSWQNTDKDACQKANPCKAQIKKNGDEDSRYELWAADAAITAAVKYNFSKDPYIQSLNIHVETKDGIVLLTGFVDRAATIERVNQLTRSVKGVKSVNNQLEIIWG